MIFTDPDVAKIVAFLERIGIKLIVEPLPADTLLPGATVRRGALVFDPDRLRWPGDLLHEAGHIAVTEAALRATIASIGDDGGEEMAATAWSYAAALEIGVDPALVLHEDFKAGGPSILANFREGRFFGVPLLQYYGMTAEPHQAERLGMPPFPAMTHWLRR